ncbi:MAG: stage II sporulation protein R [Defluviitaleaceae bacterium]|nr:stage II sporulation protein R [Defluviitaleaceae bacterium]MCL2275107.1 stage II sporulation protein R [Defluviitaleaceae bacterium]
MKIIKEARLMGVSLALGLAFAVLVGAVSYVYSDVAQREIADNVLRFHVLAHSNEAFEQDLKNAVRDGTLAQLGEMLSQSECLEITRGYIVARLAEIEASGQMLINEKGASHNVTAEITRRFFPTVVYGGVVFPPGQYETLLITIGEGAGLNWWCLMFPPLCYVDITSSDTTRGLLEDNVSAEGFALLTHREQNDPTVMVRFRVVEWWQNRRSPADTPLDLQRAAR